MIRHTFKIFLFLLLMGVLPLSAQLPALRDTVRYSVTLGGLYSSGQYAPFWLQSLNYGRVYHTPTTAYGSVSVFKDYGYRYRIFDYGFKADFLARTDMEIKGIYTPVKKEFFFHELYAKARLMSFQIIAGAKEEIIGTQDSTLSAGGFIFSKNARPIPKITAGFTDYVAIPSTNEKLLIKGALSHGWFLDDSYAKDVLLHHKYFYFKIVGSDYPWWIEAGADHFAQWGGEFPKLGRMKVSLINYIKVFFGKKGGLEATPGDQVNAYGNHIISQSVKAGANLGEFKITAYWQNLTEDGPIKFFWGAMNREDGLFGISIKNENLPFIKGFLYEYLNTTDQSGPYHVKDGMVYGGSDNYFSSEYGSWSYFFRTMGTAFISSPIYFGDKNYKMKNIWLINHHFGFEGSVTDVNFKFLFSHNKNFGNLRGIFFAPPKPNTSLLLELNKTFGQRQQTEIKLSLGSDIGQMYGNNYGAMLTVRTTGELFRLRAPRMLVNPLW